MKVFLFAPFFSGSHRQWAESYARRSGHTVRLFTLPGRHWKWRMHGAAVKLAELFLAQPDQPDLLLTTDMLDTATFLALTRKRTGGLPVAVYFHENQLTYPWSPTDEDTVLQRDRHYAWLNYTSALAADAVFFNSDYHRRSFLSALPPFLRAFPDYRGLPTVADIERKAKTLYLGMDLANEPSAASAIAPGPPVLLWNHRWEYDKRPEVFFEICERLREEGVPFRLIVLGERYQKSPPVFLQARERLRDHILHWGYVESRQEYLQWLQHADILPVTSAQDFFGGSIVEAMYRGVYPLLPRRLAYPEHIPAIRHDRHLYGTEEELRQKLRALLAGEQKYAKDEFRAWATRYDWGHMAVVYDTALEKMIITD